MLSRIALTTLRRAAPMVATRAPVVAQATAARYATTQFMSEKPFAVDAPDGDHDLQDVVSRDPKSLPYASCVI